MELKTLVEERAGLLPLQAVCGIWVKHRVGLLLPGDAALLPVTKARRLRVFGRLPDGTVAERAAADSSGPHCGVELVRVACEGRSWAGFAIEAGGSIDDAAVLLADTARAVAIGPDWVDGGIAASYPEWLDRMVLGPAS